MAEIDPPWRTDPLEIIVAVHFPRNKHKSPAKPKEPHEPGKCGGKGFWAYTRPFPTCVCPGILCVVLGVTSFTRGLNPYVVFFGPAGPGSACASGMWWDGGWQYVPATGTCRGGDGDSMNEPDFNAPVEAAINAGLDARLVFA